MGLVRFSWFSWVSHSTTLVYFLSSSFSFFPAALAASMRTFFFTPTAFPDLPVVLVLCPRPVSPREGRTPFQLWLSFMMQMHELILRARSEPPRVMFIPVSLSLVRM